MLRYLPLSMSSAFTRTYFGSWHPPPRWTQKLARAWEHAAVQALPLPKDLLLFATCQHANKCIAKHNMFCTWPADCLSHPATKFIIYCYMFCTWPANLLLLISAPGHPRSQLESLRPQFAGPLPKSQVPGPRPQTPSDRSHVPGPRSPGSRDPGPESQFRWSPAVAEPLDMFCCMSRHALMGLDRKTDNLAALRRVSRFPAFTVRGCPRCGDGVGPTGGSWSWDREDAQALW